MQRDYGQPAQNNAGSNSGSHRYGNRLLTVGMAIAATLFVKVD